MYMFYLISAVAVSTGIGAFVQYDTVAKTRDLTAESRVQVTWDQQETISRSIRRQFQMNPGSFPSVSATGFAKLNPSLINASITQGGLLNLDESNYYITAFGDVMAVAVTGPAAPDTRNGDLRVGVSGFDMHVDNFMRYLYGPNWERVTFENGGSVVGSQLNISANIDPSIADDIVRIAKIDMQMLDYEQTIASHTSDTIGSELTASYEPHDFLEIQARIMNR